MLFYLDYLVRAYPLHSVAALATNQSLLINIWTILLESNHSQWWWAAQNKNQAM